MTGGVRQLQAVERDHLVFGRLTMLELVDSVEGGHFPFTCHAAQAVELAEKGERRWMIDEIVPADPRTGHRHQVSVPTPDNGDHVAGSLDFVGVSGSGAFTSFVPMAMAVLLGMIVGPPVDEGC